LEAVETERACLVDPGACGNSDRGDRQADRDRVHEHVARVSEQRERTREDGDDCLRDHEHASEHEHDAEAGAIPLAGACDRLPVLVAVRGHAPCWRTLPAMAAQPRRDLSLTSGVRYSPTRVAAPRGSLA